MNHTYCVGWLFGALGSLLSSWHFLHFSTVLGLIAYVRLVFLNFPDLYYPAGLLNRSDASV